MTLRDGRKDLDHIPSVRSQGTDQSVGKYCTKGNDRCAAFTTRGGVLWREEAGEKVVDRARNHYELECWIKSGNLLAPVYVGGSSGSELAGHLAAAPKRAGAEIWMDVQLQGTNASPADAEICIQSKGRDACHRQWRSKNHSGDSVRLRSAHQGQPHVDFMVGTDMSAGAVCASTVSTKEEDSTHCLFDSLMVVRTRHSQFFIQSDGKPASEVVMCMVQSKLQ